jgi:hypothetical protein
MKMNRFADRLDVGYMRKKEVKDDSFFWPEQLEGWSYRFLRYQYCWREFHKLDVPVRLLSLFCLHFLYTFNISWLLHFHPYPLISICINAVNSSRFDSNGTSSMKFFTWASPSEACYLFYLLNPLLKSL